MFRSNQFFDYLSNWKDLKNLDTRILCSDGECWVHRLVLCHASPFMGSLLDDQFPGEETVYSIPDISRDTMNLLLELAYTGSIRLNQSKFDDLQDAMQFLGWIRVDQCEIIFEDVNGYKAPETITEKEKHESEKFLSGLEMKNLIDTAAMTPESTKCVSLVTHEAAAKAVMEDMLLQIENVDKVDVAVDEQMDVVETDEKHSMSEGPVDDENTGLAVNNDQLSNGNVTGCVPVELIDLDNDTGTETSVAPDCEIIQECKGSPKDRKRFARKRTRDVLVFRTSPTTKNEQTLPSASFVSSKRTSLRIRAAAGKKFTGETEPNSTHHSVKNDIGTEIEPGCSSKLVAASEIPSVIIQEPGNGAGLRNKKASTPSTPSNHEPLRGFLDSSISSRPALVEEETSNGNGSTIVEITDSSPKRKRSTRVFNLSSPDKGAAGSVHNCSDSESSSTMIKSRARGGKISISDWKKLVVCSVCKSKSTPSQTETCLLSHDYLRCWTCLDTIPSVEFESHLKNIHKEKVIQEKIPCKWCGAEGNSSWMGVHVASHSPPQKLS